MRNSQKPRTDPQRAADAGLTLDEWIEAMEEAQRHYAETLNDTIEMLDRNIEESEARIRKFKHANYED